MLDSPNLQGVASEMEFQDGAEKDQASIEGLTRNVSLQELASFIEASGMKEIELKSAAHGGRY